jgi:hypothetical protein
MSRRVRFKDTAEEASTGDERKLKKRLRFRRKKSEKRKGGGKGRSKASKK